MDNNNINDIMGKLKALVKKGNVSRIVICKDEKELVNIPVNVGIVGGVVGLAAAKWVVIAAVLATVGFGCTVQVIKEDGEVSDVYGKEQAEKARNMDAGIVDDVKEKFNLDEVVDKAAGVVNEVKDKLNLDEIVNKAANAADEVKEKFSFDEVVDATIEDIPTDNEPKEE